MRAATAAANGVVSPLPSLLDTDIPFFQVSAVKSAQKVLQFQSRGTLFATLPFNPSPALGTPPVPGIGVPGVAVASELVRLFALLVLSTRQARYRSQQCWHARDNAPSGWNSASWSRGIRWLECSLQKTWPQWRQWWRRSKRLNERWQVGASQTGA